MLDGVGTLFWSLFLEALQELWVIVNSSVMGLGGVSECVEALQGLCEELLVNDVGALQVLWSDGVLDLVADAAKLEAMQELMSGGAEGLVHDSEMVRSSGPYSGVAGISGTTTSAVPRLTLRTSGLCTGRTA